MGLTEYPLLQPEATIRATSHGCSVFELQHSVGISIEFMSSNCRISRCEVDKSFVRSCITAGHQHIR